MAAEAMMQEEIEVPEGGIAELVMDDQTADEVYGADEEEVPSGGIAQFESVAEQMAAMGREGDNMLAHLETGELVIPRRFLEENEEFKSYVMAFFDGQGVDPDRYIAGSDANSINPETGVAEFFFKKIFKKIKKAVKKVGKTVKKVVKKVVQVAKKVAPVVLPMIGTAIFGPVFGAAAGSGIATLLNGGSVKDAFKSALLSGATGAVAGGIRGAMTPGVGFAKGMSAAANPANFSQGLKNIGTFMSGDKGILQGGLREAGIGTLDTSTFGPAGKTMGGKTISSLMSGAESAGAGGGAGGAGGAGGGGGGVANTGEKTLTQKAKDLVFGPEPTAEQIGTAKATAYKDALTAANQKGIVGEAATNLANQAASEITKETLGPSLFRKALGVGAVGTGVLAATGGFKTPPQEDPGLVEYAEDGTAITGEDKIAAEPGKYLVDNLYGQLGAGPYEVGTSFGLNPTLPVQPSNPFQRPTFPQMIAKEGGDVPDLANDPRLQAARMYPRRNGGIMPNEGTPGKDSVRALLMPGEFVMTTDAVKGLGGGNLDKGINNMYSVMRNLESRGRQMA